LRAAALVTFVLVAAAAAELSTQSVTIKTVSGAVQVQAPGFAFIDGPVADRLRDGRSVRLEVALVVLDQPRGTIVTQARQAFALSFDLWEERFAVTRVGMPPRSMSHRSVKNAEAWCLEQVTVPVTTFGRLGRGAPFWIRLSYRVLEMTPEAEANPDEGLTLAALIDRLSRRGDQDQMGRSLEAGPFRLGS
jgi:hypothetical protein